MQPAKEPARCKTTNEEVYNHKHKILARACSCSYCYDETPLRGVLCRQVLAHARIQLEGYKGSALFISATSCMALEYGAASSAWSALNTFTATSFLCSLPLYTCMPHLASA